MKEINQDNFGNIKEHVGAYSDSLEKVQIQTLCCLGVVFCDIRDILEQIKNSLELISISE